MPPKAQQQQFKSTNTHKVFNQDTLKIIKTTPIKSNAIQTSSVSIPIIIKSPNLPNTEPIQQQTQKIILPASTQSTIISSNILPNTETPKEEQDNTMTYVLIGAVIIGFIILQNKDI